MLPIAINIQDNAPKRLRGRKTSALMPSSTHKDLVYICAKHTEGWILPTQRASFICMG
jgi:hypothetical protein